MPRTRRDLVNEALTDLGVLAAGQTAEAEDFDGVNGKVDALFAWLESAQIYDIDDIEEIPDDVFNELSILLADRSCYMFGLPGVPRNPNDPVDPVQKAIDRIRLTTYARPTGERLKTEYY
jgi:hypothetical protein